MQSTSDLIKALGGTVAVAKALDVAPTTVSSWKSSDSIPRWRMPGIRELARVRGIDVSDRRDPRAAA